MKKITVFVILALALALCSCMIKEQSDDYYFVAGGVEILPGIRAEEVLSHLGASRSMQSTPSCAFDGEERVYAYSGFDLYTECYEGKEVIIRVALTSDLVATERGVRVGDSFHEVVRSYGRDYETSGENIEYDGARCKLQFFFREGVVTSIKYLADD